MVSIINYLTATIAKGSCIILAVVIIVLIYRIIKELFTPTKYKD